MAEYSVGSIDQLMALIKRHEHERKEKLDSVLVEAAAAGLALLVSEAPHAGGHLQQSFHLEDGGHEIIADAPYAAAVELGVRPGHFPNLTALKDWVRIKKLAESDAEVDHVAFLIGRYIQENGIEPTWFVKSNIPKLREILKRLLEARLHEP